MNETIIFPNQKYAKLSAEGFLERAFMWLNSGIDLGLFYAGLELRGCFEKIWLKHGIASDDDSDEFFKLNWKPQDIRKHLKEELATKIDITKSYVFTFDKANPSLTMGYYLAMPDSLFREKFAINDFVHAQWAIPIGAPDRVWYKEKHALLTDFATKLIPHASGKNSLCTSCMPNIEAHEIDSEQIKPTLCQSLKGIEGS